MNPVQLPEILNIGSGKNWREDCLNVDIDPYWRPDVLADLNEPFPPDEPLECGRYGCIVIPRGHFRSIIARDVLEHVRELRTLMTSCLNLLRDGGVMTVIVPYDLSYGAWQDPTHVRAFNERSWWYYTDWFWYIGWKEARFDLDELEWIHSPLGEELLADGADPEAVKRTPRAVDAMRVELRKRPLREKERLKVEKYLQRPTR